MKLKLATIACLAFGVLSCSKVPISGRKQVNLLPETTLMGMSITNYKTFLSQNTTVAATTSDATMVKRVGEKVSKAITIYLNKNGASKRIKGFNWEFNLVQSNEVNAWCMPGGKVVVYTGILPITKDETGLAVVMGHEIAHAIARHGNERMSQQLVIQAGGMGLGAVIAEKPELAQQLFLGAYGVGANLGSLAYSRAHESEADKLGLVFMALAGYDPSAAVGFWERMAAQGGGGAPLQILSTHPSDATRIKQIKEFLPEALKYYKK